METDRLPCIWLMGAIDADDPACPTCRHPVVQHLTDGLCYPNCLGCQGYNPSLAPAAAGDVDTPILQADLTRLVQTTRCAFRAAKDAAQAAAAFERLMAALDAALSPNARARLQRAERDARARVAGQEGGGS